jgi:aspartate aminotransferase
MKDHAARTKRVKASETVRISGLVAEKKQQGIDITSFSVGEPDFDTPQHVREAAKKALDAGETHYTPAGGIHPLREAIAEKHRRENQIQQAQAQDVVVTPTKHAIALTMLALVDHGDEVLLPDPCWVSYEPLVRLAGGTPVFVPLDQDDGFRMRAESLAEKITPKTKLLITNSPSNPTGGTDLEADVKAHADLCKDHDLYLMSDEIYEHIRYEGEHLSPASLPDMYERTITINGLSKSFAMTGWRTGWSLAPAPITKEILKLQGHTITHVTTFAQHGALAALTGTQQPVKDMLQVFTRRRETMLEALNGMPGVTCPTPRGAFYVFPRIEAGGMDDMQLTEHLIENAHIAVTPGSAFGPAGKGHIRISYATSEDRIQQGMKRMRDALEALG